MLTEDQPPIIYKDLGNLPNGKEVLDFLEAEFQANKWKVVTQKIIFIPYEQLWKLQLGISNDQWQEEETKIAIELSYVNIVEDKVGYFHPRYFAPLNTTNPDNYMKLTDFLKGLFRYLLKKFAKEPAINEPVHPQAFIEEASPSDNVLPDPPIQVIPQVSPEIRKPKFVIQKKHSGYEPSERHFFDPPQTSVLNDFRGNGDPWSYLFLTHKAFFEIQKHIEWGAHTMDNSVEQGGMLLGEVFLDKSRPKPITFGIVTETIPALHAQGSSAYLRIDHAAWGKIIEELDERRTLQPGQNKQIIGWYHTHPNSLDVFMSGTDLNTQRTFFYNSWQFAIVLNPHKKIWRSFVGAEATECIGYILPSTYIEK